MGKIGDEISAILTAIIGLAILAVIVSGGSNTVNVITAAFSGLNALIRTAITPVTGGSIASTGSYPVISAAGGNYGGSNSLYGSSLSGSSGGITIGGFGGGAGGSLSISGSTLNSLTSGLSNLFGTNSNGTSNSASGSDTGWYDV